MRKALRFRFLQAAAIACGLDAGLSALVHPSGRILQQTSASSFLEGNTNPEAVKILERSCQNCHSEKTHWPWYSYIAPMSWLIEKDVNTARSYMNLTKWTGYNSDEKAGILHSIAPLIRNQIMPPPRYIALHPEAKLSGEDIDRLVRWSRQELTRIQQKE